MSDGTSNPRTNGELPDNGDANGRVESNEERDGATLDGEDLVLSYPSSDEEMPAFLSDRLCYLREQVGDGQSVHPPTGVGTIESVRDRTESVVEEMTSPDGGECPHCGLALAEDGPPMCPRCGAPH